VGDSIGTVFERVCRGIDPDITIDRSSGIGCQHSEMDWRPSGTSREVSSRASDRRAISIPTLSDDSRASHEPRCWRSIPARELSSCLARRSVCPTMAFDAYSIASEVPSIRVGIDNLDTHYRSID
jgi:hypothetical protein